MEQNEDEMNILKEKDFILTSDKNNEYEMKFFINSNDLFCLTAITTKNNSSKKYSLSLSMNDLIKNRFFKIFVNVEEIFRELENKIEKSILIEDTNLIYLDIPIGLNVINDIILEIKESKKSYEAIIQELMNELNDKNILIKEKDNKINELEKKLKEKELEKEKLKFSNYNNFYFYNIDNSYENYVLIQSQQYESIKFKELLILEKNFYICHLLVPNFENKKIFFNLIYKAKIDGDKAKNFHNKVDGKGPLVILVKTSKNIIIGGYTSKPWSSSNYYMEDHDAFLFSLTNKKTYNIVNPKYACLHLENSGPCFGNNLELKIFDNCFIEENAVNFESIAYNIDNKNLIGEKRLSTFKIIDYEVYQIIYYN